ncbi:stage III sporulation protein AF [Virgibacillus sp. 179-BFC.A HS]|uniref:Stage III sporulation protein AF n=1 Tax=Tigheibacillus jepli TaxID=3035914 RepID=A0ABU5CH11_9BACI|nr:stage III sporulation protein AF [Virgibacillus sp. 179-BFC.A HS]MDY0405609.1 stage III sporulation protein AF [Virgibacillus sp. 179-BFC.A HS]
MSMLIHWVTQIIVFILLATIIDLLVPANAMKKYIQFAVGLILILVFLKPVFYLFQIDVKQAIQTNFQQQQNEILKEDVLKNTMEKQKREIESSERAYILQQMAVQLKNLANKEVAKEFHVQITNIDFEFEGGQAS